MELLLHLEGAKSDRKTAEERCSLVKIAKMIMTDSRFGPYRAKKMMEGIGVYSDSPVVIPTNGKEEEEEEKGSFYFHFKRVEYEVLCTSFFQFVQI